MTAPKIFVNGRELDPKAECALCVATKEGKSLIVGGDVVRTLVLCTSCVEKVRAYFDRQN